jgi:hypothetical protein
MNNLDSWNDTATKQSIVEFAETAAQSIPPEERVAVFDNDGTLWCEKPMPVELGFILQRWAAMVEEDNSLREKQPWKAAYEKDYAWLGGVIDKHYAGDDTDLKVVMGGILRTYAGQTVEEFAASAAAFLADAEHPTLGRRLRDGWYLPMVELLRYLEASGFTCFIASGGSRDFMRDHRGALRDPARAGRREFVRPRVHGQRTRRIARLPRRPRRLRRRAREAGAHLEPDRPAAGPRRRQLERRRPHAALRRRERTAGAPPPRAPRRCRA